MNSIKTILLFLILVSGSLNAQTKYFANPDSILIGTKKRPKVLLVGTWHFSYPGLDAHRTEEKDKINIYPKRRQLELEELLDYLSKFQPTKIVVESGKNTGYIINNYKNHKKGEERLYANERSQIGMRLVDKFNLDTIYGVDAWPLLVELNTKRDTLKSKTYIDTIFDRHYFGGKDHISKKYSAFYNYKTTLTVKNTLLESFKYFNSEKVINRGFGTYIAGGQFESEHFEGPDALSMFWINRNIRIFKNIKDLNYNKNDRILVLFGAGHISILRWLFDCSPEFELIDFDNLEV